MISTRGVSISPFVIPAISAVLVLLLLPLADSSSTKSLMSSHRSDPHDAQKLSPQLLNQITLHGFLLWASMGFLMPVGILISRMSNRVQCGKRLKIIFITHVSMQVVSILLATAGAVLAVKYFENSFNNTHQRIGLALYALILVQPLVGLLRPHRGVKGRSIWYFVHWFTGTGLSILAIINIYIGLRVYEKKTLKSTRLWMILFSMEVSLIAFVYLFQDRWDYMQKQGVILGHEQITPTDQVTPPNDTPKESYL